MQAERIVNEARKLGFVVMAVVGLALGAALPALAETASSDFATTCGAVNPTSSRLATTAAPATDPGAIPGNGGRDCDSCALDVVPADAGEWAVPPNPGQPGAPY